MGNGKVKSLNNRGGWLLWLQHYLSLSLCCWIIILTLQNLKTGRKRATVAWPRNCTLCRQCVRENYGEEVKVEGIQREKWIENVALRRVKNHFICKKIRNKTFILLCSSWYVLKENIIEFCYLRFFLLKLSLLDHCLLMFSSLKLSRYWKINVNVLSLISPEKGFCLVWSIRGMVLV